jgi:general L-amino acid transport system permease protein
MTAAVSPPRYTARSGRIALQVLLAVIIGGLFYGAFVNAADNLARAHIASGFHFWNNSAGFDISQTLISYSSSTSTFGRAFWVGLLNTLVVAGLGIVLATLVGFTVGIARLSRNWLVARLAGGYVELIRNIPLLLQLLFWYNAVLKALPELRSSIALPIGGFLNNRGLFLPRPVFEPGFVAVVAALLVGIAAAVILRIWARRRRERTGAQRPRRRWVCVPARPCASSWCRRPCA